MKTFEGKRVAVAVRQAVAAASVCLLAASGAHATAPIIIGGVDAQSLYEGFTDLQPNAGVFTFNDVDNGVNQPEKGFVDTPPAGFDAFIGATVDLDMVFDTSVCNPAACAIQDAEFKGANAGADLIFWPSGGGPIPLLALELIRIEVVNATPSSGGIIALGGQVVNPGPNLFATSELAILGGSEAAAIIAAVGGSRAILRMDIDKPKDEFGNKIVIGDLLASGDWFNDDFSVGLPNITPVGGVNFDLVIVPEPGTAALFGLSLLALGALSRRR